MDAKINWDDCPIGAMMSAKLENIHEDIREIVKDVKTQNKRVNTLELKIAKITVWGSVIITLIALATTLSRLIIR